MSDRRAFATLHRQLLRQEREAEVAEAERLLHQRSDAELVARGTALLRLEVVDLEPGFGGRLCAVLRPSRGGELPPHRFGPGDVVAVRAGRDEPSLCSAVVVRARRDGITVSLEDGPGGEEVDLPSIVRLDRMVTDVTFRRLDQALGALQQEEKGDRARFLDVLFGERDAAPLQPTAPPQWFDPTLDESQRHAIAAALTAEHVALIHGPPGTGKTTALVELIRQAVARGDRVLACAPSNVAVDNLAERLARAGLGVVRLGHPARVHPDVRDVSLAQQVADAPEQKLLKDAKKDLDQALRRLHKAKTRADRAAARAELRQLRAERRQLEQAITIGLLDRAEVVLATTTGASEAGRGDRAFGLVVVDEAAQAMEAACWIPLQHASRLVLAGDYCQLPPTILDADAARRGLARTMFERLSAQAGTASLRCMLTVQYRMHEKIMGWSSRTFYGGELRAADAVREHRLDQLPGVATTEWTEAALCFVDTAGCGHEETTEGDEESKHNPGEADLVVRIVAELREAGVAAADIAVITPYNAQVQRLRERLGDDELEIGTVDGLQGREKEAVVVSLVRSNERGEVGFLAELRRLNVALTRARRHLTVIGDSATLASDRDLCTLVEHLQQHGVYRSAFELA
ncbi:MAG: AAA family ATPase [Planctomycetes bacterium]|nr:AAA family ATPase [Planctomycetota bacterium]